MLHLHPTRTTTMPPSSKPKRLSPNPNHHSSTTTSSSLLCKHSPSATLDILILILVLFSCTFLLISYLTYIFQSLSQILPPPLLLTNSFQQFPVFYILGLLIFFTGMIVTVEICFSLRSRKCDKVGCKGMRNAMEFDIKLETEESLKLGGGGAGGGGGGGGVGKEIDDLPWKGGTAVNPDYECLRSELRKMAPVNGRAILLFRAKCGCPVAKLEAWGAKRGKRHKKALSNVVTNGGGNKQR